MQFAYQINELIFQTNAGYIYKKAVAVALCAQETEKLQYQQTHPDDGLKVTH